MIELSPQAAIMAYLCIAIAVMLVLWLTQHFKTRQKTIITTEKKLITCEYCNSPYLAKIEKNISKCPKCHSLNQGVRS